ncbi:hypothetical protein BDZ45DRAFT_681752 [Acephala macrosclerotiorum]|nr:hypothetical protein BDZ45DRAFT_681752 [Acephala macrosclerotiorum]
MATAPQGPAPAQPTAGSTSSGNNSQPAVATGNNAKSSVPSSYWKDKTFLVGTILTILGLLTAVIYFVLPYLAAVKANKLAQLVNELSQLESCRSHPNDAYLQSLDVCKSAHEEGDFDASRLRRSTAITCSRTRWFGVLPLASVFRGSEEPWNQTSGSPSALRNRFLLGSDERVWLHRYWLWILVPSMLRYMAIQMLPEGDVYQSSVAYHRSTSTGEISVLSYFVLFLSFLEPRFIIVLQITVYVCSQHFDVSRPTTIIVVDDFLRGIEGVSAICTFCIFLLRVLYRSRWRKLRRGLKLEPFLTKMFLSFSPDAIALVYSWKLFWEWEDRDRFDVWFFTLHACFLEHLDVWFDEMQRYRGSRAHRTLVQQEIGTDLISPYASTFVL